MSGEAAPIPASTARDWESAAGGKMEFDVASVKEDKSDGRSYSNFSLDSGNLYSIVNTGDISAPTGTYFSAINFPLARYIVFAYKLSGTQELALRFNYFSGLSSNVPRWVNETHFDITARATGAATKDQMRLMMQSLLADRFKLAVHMEMRTTPVFALTLVTPGKTGPLLKLHPAADTCSDAPSAGEQSGAARSLAPQATATLDLPTQCGVIAHLQTSVPEQRKFGGRNVSMDLIASSLPTQTGMVTIPRPVIDHTGLVGGYDFSIEWTPEDTSDVDNRETGDTFREALKDQLGLKLEPQKAPVAVLVLDHVEMPSAD